MASQRDLKGVEKAYPGLTSRSIKDRAIYGRKLHPDVLKGDYLRYDGKGQPLLVLADLSGPAAGTDNVGCVAYLPGVFAELHYTPIGTVTNAPFGPTADALGLDITMDQANNEGVNYVLGGLLGPWLTTVKRDISDPIPDGLYFRLKVEIVTVLGSDDFAIGFRKNEATQVNFDDYADLCALNVISGDIKRESIVGGATTVTVDTTQNWLDGEIHEITGILHGNGKVQFFIDGAEPTVFGAAYQFTEDLGVVPFIFFNQDTTTTKVHVVELELCRLTQLSASRDKR